MQVPLDITFQNSEPSEAIRSEVEKQAKRLEKFHDRITSCHVTVIAPTMKRRHGDLFKIDICVAMPNHKDILVSKAHGDAPGTRARHGRDQGCIRGGTAPDQGCRSRNARPGQAAMKRKNHGHVAKFVAGEGYGFIETADGRKVYFGVSG